MSKVSVDIEKETILIEGIKPEALGESDFGFISILLSEDKADIISEGLKMPFETFYTLNKNERLSLGFPPECPYTLSLKTNGAVLLPNFSISYSFKKNGRKVFGEEIKDRIFIECDGDKFTLPSYTGEILSLINEHKALDSIKDKNRKSEVFERLMELIPPEVKGGDDRLKTIQINFAECFSLDLDEKTAQIHPTMLCSEEGTTLLNVEADKKMKKLFLDSSHVQSYYHLGHNKFVFIPARLKKTLSVVKKVQSKSAPERLGFFNNPGGHLEKEIETGSLDESDLELFKETDQYISDRIEKLGEWNPKNYTFDPGTKNEWVPTNAVVFCTDEKIHHIKEDDLVDVLTDIEKAKKAGKSTIDYEGQEIEITPDFEDFVKERIKGKKSSEGSGDKGKEEPVTGEVPKPLVPIIFDNIEGDFYVEPLSPRPGVDINDPSSRLIYTLKKHQEICLNWLQESFKVGKRGALLADDMGLGKTFQTLAFLSWLKEEMVQGREKGGPFLIVGPTALLKNWEEEHSNTLKYDGLGDLVEAYGGGLRALRNLGREQAVERLKDCSWALTTYDSMKNHQSLFRRVNWKVLVFDEIQKIKNPNSFVTEMAKALAADFTLGLTGTPVENSLLDLWCLSDAIWAGILGPYKQFKTNYQGKDANLDELKSCLTEKDPPPFMLRRLKEGEIEGLPKKTENLVPEKMEVKQAQAYDEIIKGAQNGEFSGNPFEIVHRLKRVSLGFWSETMSEDEIIQNCARLKAALKILDEIKKRQEKVLIFVESREFQQILLPLLMKRYNLNSPPMLINGTTPTKIRQKYVNTFEELPPGFDVMLISPKAGGTGFTLINANNVIHLERAWNPAIEDQCSDRVYRLKQTKDVNIYIPQAIHPQVQESSFDQVLHELLTSKRQLSRQVIVPTGLGAKDKADFLKKTANISDDFIALNENFYKSEEWKQLSRRFKAQNPIKCSNAECGKAYPRYPKSDFHVDHIKPRSKYPKLALDPSNLQILCAGCNLKKSDKVS